MKNHEHYWMNDPHIAGLEMNPKVIESLGLDTTLAWILVNMCGDPECGARRIKKIGEAETSEIIEVDIPLVDSA